MTIEEAIDYLNSLHGDTFPYTSYRQKALQLGIEALKNIKADREAIPGRHSIMLPSETAD